MRKFDFWCADSACTFHGQVEASNKEEAKSDPKTVHVTEEFRTLRLRLCGAFLFYFK